jgi:hypothetical protein
VESSVDIFLLEIPLNSAFVFLAVALTVPHPAFGWGDVGHEIIALIAAHYLDPAARAKIVTLLAADTAPLTGHDIASEATWADKYRDGDRDFTKILYQATRLWHIVDIELAEPKPAAACFDHPLLPAGLSASEGPPRACVVDKIHQFASELGNPATSELRAAPGAQVPSTLRRRPTPTAPRSRQSRRWREQEACHS